MGCAQWCAYAEQCLGPAARGLKTKSLKVLMEDELKRLVGHVPGKLAEIEDQVNAAAEKCRREKIDMLPIIAAIIVVSLHRLGLVNDIEAYLEQLSSEHNLPAQAIQNTKEQIAEMLQSNTGCNISKVK